MSSFVISKGEYTKVAGLVAGIVTERNRFEPEIWLFDHEAGHNMTADGYRERFMRCYDANVESVCKQYGDDPAEYGDDSTYDSVYNEYFVIGKNIARDRARLRDVIYEIRFFSRSVSYQIEDEALNIIVMGWFTTIIVLLFDLIDDRKRERESWGSFKLPWA